ncbi:uncharacterized protein LOC128992103 [Macrosteles quadrilineatus]|uniref:uncharacterized protein LOC128992103 n=1 Tax=Macrosteles quadrilineatus TaxID=74068 RepID=UPI0023E25B24|nr:uncharacterized protein LOC128992103 [Macrosteles quadrilineatus]
MGCGQSQIGIIYPRKSKNKEGTKRNGEGSENEEDEKDGESDADSEEAQLRAARLKQIVQIAPGPLLAQAELSTSQSDFFKMLDDKIENGPDYDSTCEYEIAMEHARLCRLLQDWEMAKIRSRNRLMTMTKPVRYPSLQPNGNLPRQRYSLANSVVTYDQRGGYYTELA